LSGGLGDVYKRDIDYYTRLVFKNNTLCSLF